MWMEKESWQGSLKYGGGKHVGPKKADPMSGCAQICAIQRDGCSHEYLDQLPCFSNRIRAYFTRVGVL